ncbi:MAG: hypothetical protein WCF65_04780 [Parachlamydiaceae bacterium]
MNITSNCSSGAGSEQPNQQSHTGLSRIHSVVTVSQNNQGTESSDHHRPLTRHRIGGLSKEDMKNLITSGCIVGIIHESDSATGKSVVVLSSGYMKSMKSMNSRPENGPIVNQETGQVEAPDNFHFVTAEEGTHFAHLFKFFQGVITQQQLHSATSFALQDHHTEVETNHASQHENDHKSAESAQQQATPEERLNQQQEQARKGITRQMEEEVNKGSKACQKEKVINQNKQQEAKQQKKRSINKKTQLQEDLRAEKINAEKH